MSPNGFSGASPDPTSGDPAFVEETRPNIGRLLLDSFELFAERIVVGVRDRGFPDFRLTDTKVLRYLEADGTQITVLAERAHMTKQAMSELVRRVERQGYVERRPDPDDGRAKRVHLTTTGEKVTEAARAAYRSTVRDWREALGADRFARLQRLLVDLLESQDAAPAYRDLFDVGASGAGEPAGEGGSS